MADFVHTGLILGLSPANERYHYKVTPSLIGWAAVGANLGSALWCLGQVCSDGHVWNQLWIIYCQAWWQLEESIAATGLTHAKLVSLTSPCCSGWPAPNEYSSRPTTRAEQRWVHWLQCLIRKWSCVNHQFQFNTQIAYEPTYMAHDGYYLLLFNYWHWYKI